MTRSTKSVSRRRVLVDTNVLVYGVDPSAQAKAEISAGVLRAIVGARVGVLSPQILAEFFDVATRPRNRLAPLLDRTDALRAIVRFLAAYECLALDGNVVAQAAMGAVQYGLRIYDAQIWAIAKLHSIDLILTEDMPAQRVIDGVRYINPFEPSFRIAHLGL